MAKKSYLRLIFGVLTLVSFWCGLYAENLILLHTNDTHSMILPDKDGLGGVQRRKALIDSVRGVEKNVLLIDAGDAVQGTLFFKFFKGEVEYPLLDMLGYDIRVLGNHEFDNGIEELVKYNKNSRSAILSTNYDASQTSLKGLLKPYVIKKYGDKRIGIMGLNIDPKGLITESNIAGVVWSDVIECANRVAHELKHKKRCDLVVAVTHIGYEKSNDKTTDVELAKASRDIDVIIGGHSHTLVDPTDKSGFPYLIENLDGKKVLVAQCGKSGKYLGYIKIDLERLNTPFESKLLKVDSRLDGNNDSRIDDFLSDYVEIVDSVNSVPIAYASMDMSNEYRQGAFPNWVADYAQHFATSLVDTLKVKGDVLSCDNVDFSIMNVGGIRQSISKGNVSEGQILSAFPFSNRMVLLKIKGKDLREVFSAMARKGGEAVSDEVRVVVDSERKVKSIFINDELLNDGREYLVCTIDYLAWGNDDLDSLAKGEIIWSDNVEMSVRVLEYVVGLTNKGLPICADQNPRFIEWVKVK